MEPPIDLLLAALVAFVGGSLPFAVWIPRLLAGRDVRLVGDGNPGAMNALRAGGVMVGLAVLLLDVSKGVVPVVLAKDALALRGWGVAAAAVLSVLGAAFSPFLRFRGGKALAVTLGTWIGWTVWSVPLVALVAIVGATLLVEPDGWAVALALAATLVAVVLWGPGPWAPTALVLQAAIVLFKHRSELARPLRRRGAGPRAP